MSDIKTTGRIGKPRLFDRFATGCARFTGRPLMFGLCVALCLAGIGAYVSGSDHLIGGTNLAINILTLLILPILQATQNRDGAALQAKIDELIATSREASNALIGLENRSEEEIEALRNARGPGCDPDPLAPDEPNVTGR